ncbi:MAG TPA: ABC transporter substrate-binding protein, partial [Ramlibacter sp.]|nr:ABC transporter substrate-binding protein [Ramlibacter sp.]
MNSHSRRQALASALFVAACFGSPAQAQSNDPIKIGLMNIDTGPFTAHGQQISQGVRTIVDILNSEGGIAGRKLEIVLQ